MNTEVWTAAMGVVSGLSSLATAVIACIGLFTWRKQYRTQVNFDLARNLSRATNKVTARIRGVRAAVSIFVESNTENSDREEAEERRYKANLRTIVKEDYAEFKQALEDLGDAVREAEMVWKRNALHFQHAMLCFMCIDSEISLALHPITDRGEGDMTEESQRKAEEHLQKLRQTYGKDDPFGKEIEKAVQQIKAIADPHLKL